MFLIFAVIFAVLAVLALQSAKSTSLCNFRSQFDKDEARINRFIEAVVLIAICIACLTKAF